MTVTKASLAIDNAIVHKLDCKSAMLMANEFDGELIDLIEQTRIPRAVVKMVSKQHEMTSQTEGAPGVCIECFAPIDAKTWRNSGSKAMPELFVPTAEQQHLQKDKAHLRLCSRCQASNNGPIFA